ncbi:MAG: Gfo/Idh/MocA family oxidoreductase [Prolixibacteraceae bacterium]|jgi:predicted dehydrogenase|nr:Gfo/Idh/MocA family oxidoreductase [Prolixibacteraceae bacterium]
MNPTRRDFIKSASLLGAAAVFIPNLMSCSPSGRLNIAVIGVGGQGGGNWSKMINQKEPKWNENIVALCDVDDNRAADAYNAMPKAKRFRDYRVMFDQMHKEIDAVMVCTPDHSHFPAAMAAMQLGKHVIVEKPLAHNIWQLRTLKKAAHHYKVVTQMANQGHATNGIRCVKEWYDAGLLGNVTEVIAWFNGPDFGPDKYFRKPDSFPPAEQPIPAGFDWDLWLGPAEKRPYNEVYAPKTWRSWFDFGNGEMGDWCCHTLDAPYWSLDLGLPTVAEAEFKSPVPDTGFLSDQAVIRWDFPARGNKPPVTMRWYEGGLKPEIRAEWRVEKLAGTGMIMVGDKHCLITGGRPNDPRLLMPMPEWEAFKPNLPAQSIPRTFQENPQREWAEAIKHGTVPGSNFDYATGLVEMALTGVLAQRFNARIEYDAQNMKVSNHPELDAYIKEPARAGFSYGENL